MYEEEGYNGDSDLRRAGPSSLLTPDLSLALARHHFDPEMAATQRQLMGVPLIRPPAWCLTIVATGNNQVGGIDIPDQVGVISFSAQASMVYRVNFQHQFAMPGATGSLDGDLMGNDGICSPTGRFFYVRGLRRLFYGIATSGDALSVMGWVQN